MAAVGKDTTVPGMAEAVESRRKQLGLSPGGFADAAGLTRQALAPVRAGIRRFYQDVTINGVARALSWERDWYDRLLAGRKPRPSQMGGVAPDRMAAIEDRLSQIEAQVARLVDGDR